MKTSVSSAASVGSFGPCCHGDDKVQVYGELCQIVDKLFRDRFSGTKRGA